MKSRKSEVGVGLSCVQLFWEGGVEEWGLGVSILEVVFVSVRDLVLGGRVVVSGRFVYDPKCEESQGVSEGGEPMVSG